MWYYGGMKQKTYFLATACMFSAIAVLHALRIIGGWQAQIGSWDVPLWISYLAVVIAAWLAYQGFRQGKK